MTKTPRIRTGAPSASRGGPLDVLFVLLPEAELIGQLGALEAFHAANRFAMHRGRPAPYRLAIAGLEAQTISVSGLAVLTRPVEAAAPAHTVVIGGRLALGEAPLPGEDCERLRPALEAAERRVSICTGAFVLGQLGMLDGRRCTTHWLAVDALRARFPAARVEADAIFTEDGPLYTSAGATAGVDLALALIEADLGPRMARAVARALVVYLRRPGGQSQFSEAARVEATSDQRLRALVREVTRAPGDDHRVEVLAARVGMSPRNFARVFRAELGVTPAELVARIRLEAARRALEASERTQEDIAVECGFKTAETMRRVFQRALKVSPGAYRKRFSAPQPA